MLNDSTDKEYKDPLRELVLLTVDGNIKTGHTLASTLANEASALGNLKEIRIETCATKEPQPKAMLRTPIVDVTRPTDIIVPGISAVFQDPKDIVDPEKEREFLKMLKAMEESDSEGMIGDRPVLGKVSLIRRAKSAVSRTTAEQPPLNDKHPLFEEAWDIPKVAQENDSETYSISQDDEEEEEAEDDTPTVDEVKRHMELFHLRRSIPPPSAKLKDAQTGKYAKQRRPKTAKYNK